MSTKDEITFPSFDPAEFAETERRIKEWCEEFGVTDEGMNRLAAIIWGRRGR